MARSVSGDGFAVTNPKTKNSNTLDLFDNLMSETPAPTVEPKKEAKKTEKKQTSKPVAKPVEKKPTAKAEKVTEKVVVEPILEKKALLVEIPYNQPRKSITISVLEDEDMFLRFHAAKRGISRQDYLEELFTTGINKVNNNDIPSFEEIKPYMKQLKEPTRFTAMLQEDLINDIKSTASKVGLRPTSWMAYLIHEAYITNK